MKKLLSSALALALCASLAGCGSSNAGDGEDKTLKIGASITPHAEILNNIKPDLEEMGYTVEITEFSDYNTPNEAVVDGTLDANYFQHNQYLAQWNEERGTDLVSAGDVHFEPMGIYSDKYKSLDELKEGQHVTIGIPNDATNGGRALQLLASKGLFTLDESLGIKATPNDIGESKYDIEIVEMNAETVPVSLSDMDLGVVNGNNALNADVLDKLLVTEDASGVAQQFANCVAVRKGDEDSQKIKDLMSVLKSQKTIDFINEKYDGIVVPFFTVE